MVDLNKTGPFRWTAKRKHAALLLAQDELGDRAIAQAVGVARTTLHTWKQHPDFQAQIGDNIGQIQAAMLKLAIAKKHKRLEVLDKLYLKAVKVVEERAVEYMAIAAANASETDQEQAYRKTWGGAEVPAGGETGLLVRQIKQIGSGRSAKIVEEFAVDTGLLKEIRALQEQAAKELGQWEERLGVSGPGGSALPFIGIAIPLPAHTDELDGD